LEPGGKEKAKGGWEGTLKGGDWKTKSIIITRPKRLKQGPVSRKRREGSNLRGGKRSYQNTERDTSGKGKSDTSGIPLGKIFG